MEPELLGSREAWCVGGGGWLAGWLAGWLSCTVLEHHLSICDRPHHSSPLHVSGGASFRTPFKIRTGQIVIPFADDGVRKSIASRMHALVLQGDPRFVWDVDVEFGVHVVGVLESQIHRVRMEQEAELVRLEEEAEAARQRQLAEIREKMAEEKSNRRSILGGGRRTMRPSFLASGKKKTG